MSRHFSPQGDFIRLSNLSNLSFSQMGVAAIDKALEKFCPMIMTAEEAQQRSEQLTIAKLQKEVCAFQLFSLFTLFLERR